LFFIFFFLVPALSLRVILRLAGTVLVRTG